jgi:tRNA dimethylallyltransferase
MNLIVICGPTAAGKTRVAALVAHEFGLELISADSRQVYRGLDIGTGKDLSEYRFKDGSVKYHMIDIEDPANTYTLFHFQRDCYALLRSRMPSMKPLLMVGGTGLYIESVISKHLIANVPENVQLRNRLMKKEKEELISVLESVNPDLYHRTDTSSKKRVVRALEIHEYSKSYEVKYTRADDIKIVPHIFCLNPSRKDLYEKIRVRLHYRLEHGMVEEVQAILEKGLSAERLLQLGMEYREITLYLMGKKRYKEMKFDLEKGIRHMAKSQITYFRGLERRGHTVNWINNHEIDKVKRKVREIS